MNKWMNEWPNERMNEQKITDWINVLTQCENECMSDWLT